MTRPLLQGMIIGFGIVTVASCSPGLGGVESPDETERAIVHQGIERTYQLFVPSGYDGHPLPLVLVFHETYASGRDISRASDFNSLAERECFIVAYPDAVDGSWNDGRSSRESSIDDVSFTRALIEHLRDEFEIDARRVYATGYSNGGHLVNRLVLESGDAFAAVAPVASLLSVDLHLLVPDPTFSVPILLIHGTADPLTPYMGGSSFLGHGEVFSAASTVDYWVGLNGASVESRIEALPDLDSSDGTVARRELHAPLSAEGKEVIFITVNGGGHTWPSGSHFLPRAILGATSRDFSATEEIWAFFSRHSQR